MNSIGVTLIAAAIVAPAISARMITNSFTRMIISSTIIGIVISFLGLYSSYFFDSSSGSTVVLFGAVDSVFFMHISLRYIKHIGMED